MYGAGALPARRLSLHAAAARIVTGVADAASHPPLRLLPGARFPARATETTMTNGSSRDRDDYFQDTRMSFGDHIEELRQHLWRAVYGFLLALVASIFIGPKVLEFIIAPVKAQLDRYYDRRM